MSSKKSVSAEPRLSLERFLRLKPQSHGIKAVLQAVYGSAVKTKDEWERDLAALCSQKVRG